MSTKLDANQVIKEVYDEVENRLRVDAEVTATIGDVSVSIDQSNDSIRLGDGVNLITSTSNGPKQGLDTYIINDSLIVEATDLDIRNLSSITDSVSSVQSGLWNINNITGTISLPTGASTEAKQDIGNASLTSIDNDIDVALSTRASESTLSALNNKFNTLGQKTSANSAPVVLSSDQSAIPVTDNGASLTIDGTISAIQSGNWSTRLQDGSGNLITSNSAGGLIDVSRPLQISRISTALNKYMTFISIRQSAATAANAVLWSMRNSASATKEVFIDEIEIQMSFDEATPAARSTPRYVIQRFSGATPTTGSVITPCKLDESSASSQVTDIRTSSTGLVTTGITLGTIVAIPACPAVEGAAMVHSLTNLGIKLAPGEGLLISLLVTAVIGQYIGGSIIWSER